MHDALVRNELDLASGNVAAEERERASGFAIDLGGLVAQVHGLHDSAELDDLVELFRVHERFVDAAAAGFEDRLLMDGVGIVRDSIVG